MKYFLAVLSLLLGINAKAQETADPFGTSYNYDSTTFVDTSSSLSSVSKASEDPTSPSFKPYTRFKAPMDTITQKVTYMGVVPFKAMANDLYDGGNMDSLYWRAKKFLLATYVKDFRAKTSKDFVFPKDILVEDFKPDGDVGRIIITPTVPLVLRQGRSNATQNGSITFKLEIRVKDDKLSVPAVMVKVTCVFPGRVKPDVSVAVPPDLFTINFDPKLPPDWEIF